MHSEYVVVQRRTSIRAVHRVAAAAVLVCKKAVDRSSPSEPAEGREPEKCRCLLARSAGFLPASAESLLISFSVWWMVFRFS